MTGKQRSLCYLIKTLTYPLWYNIFLNSYFSPPRFKSFGVGTKSGSNCYEEYVEIFDGASLSSPRLAKVCGSELPADVTTTGRSALIRLYSPLLVFGSDIRDGFLAKYINSTYSIFK